MSTHNCPVVRVKFNDHPNADSLSIMEIDGYEVAMRTADWEEGQLAVYIPPDYWVPDTEVFAWLRGTSQSSTSWQRTRTKKFRGRYSYGFLIPLPDAISHLNPGDNAMESLGIIRYEPPENTLSGDNEAPPEGFYPKYDVENYQSFRKLFIPGEEIIATEKIHGCNARFCFVDGRMRAGARDNWKKQDSTCLWWKGITQNPWIEQWCRQNEGLVVYGELFGNVQNLRYGAIGGQLFFKAFDILHGTKWLAYDHARGVAGALLQWVPEVYRGPLDFDAMMKLATGDSKIGGVNHMMEGVVIRPVIERYESGFGRVFCKVVSPRYLEKN